MSTTSLFQCSRVCKTWRRLLSDLDFTKTLISPTLSCILISGLATGPKYPNLYGYFLLDLNHKASDQYDIVLPSRPKDIIGSCNGFLCLSHDFFPGKYSLSNPMTGEQVWIVPTEAYFFDSCGFGYSPISNVYKIVMFHKSYMSGFKVMTVGSGIWRRVEYVTDLAVYKSSSDWRYLNGFLHSMCTHCDYSLSILAFDVEKFHIDDDDDDDEIPTGVLGVLDGRLYVTVASKHNIVVWVMKDYGIKESWTRDFEIRDNSYPRANAYQLTYYKLLNYSQGRALLFSQGDRLFYTYTAGTDGLVQVDGVQLMIQRLWIHNPSFLSLKDVVHRGQSLGSKKAPGKSLFALPKWKRIVVKALGRLFRQN
ncbi:hypothetical protein ACLB2K_055003 [Fragaria x ananassa]